MTDHVHVRCFLRRESAVSARRDESTGAWRVPTGTCEEPDADGEPEATARAALRELGVEGGADHVRTGSPVREGGETYRPVLFDFDPAREGATGGDQPADGDWEWTAPTAFFEDETAPALRRSYERVAPTVRSIAADDDHGAAYLSVRALEVLRDRAALQLAEGDGDADELRDLGRRLLRARPSVAALHTRVHRALSSALGDEGGASDGVARRVLDAASEGIDRALSADAEAAAAADEVISGARVLTLSRSGTVLAALREADPGAVFVAESRPAREGVDVAERLADDLDAAVTVHTDAAIGHVLATEGIDAVVVGADAILPDGGVVNKTGTRLAAAAADREGVPVYAVAAAAKITPEETVNLESGDAAAVYDGPADLDVRNPTFDVTPGDLVAGAITDRGRLDGEGIREVADEHADLTDW